MSQAINPYQSPQAVERPPSAKPPLLPREPLLRPPLLFCVGAMIGLISFVAAISLVPASVPNPSEHDRFLAINLGFIYPPIIGMWSGWMRRSVVWSVSGAITGVLIGGVYWILCSRFNFFATLFAYPCLLGGAASVAMGSGKRSWIDGIGSRLGKGLVAGFVLGFIYTVLLNFQAFGRMPQNTQEFHQMMIEIGAVSMALASGLYLMLFVWATNLRAIILEETDRPPAHGDEVRPLTPD
jgi:hypothetical protein